MNMGIEILSTGTSKDHIRGKFLSSRLYSLIEAVFDGLASHFLTSSLLQVFDQRDLNFCRNALFCDLIVS